jgi:hypothetical protein
MPRFSSSVLITYESCCFHLNDYVGNYEPQYFQCISSSIVACSIVFVGAPYCVAMRDCIVVGADA